MSWFMGIGRAVKRCVWSFDACGNWQARMAVTRLQWDADRPAVLPAKVAMGHLPGQSSCPSCAPDPLEAGSQASTSPPRWITFVRDL